MATLALPLVRVVMNDDV